jgi:hypothetical protein
MSVVSRPESLASSQSCQRTATQRPKKILKMKISPFGPTAAQRLRPVARASLNRELGKKTHKSWQPPMNNAVAGPTANCCRVIPAPHQDGVAAKSSFWINPDLVFSDGDAREHEGGLWRCGKPRQV